MPCIRNPIYLILNVTVCPGSVLPEDSVLTITFVLEKMAKHNYLDSTCFGGWLTAFSSTWPYLMDPDTL